MTRWLRAARRASEAVTKPTQPTQPPGRAPKAGVSSIVSVLSNVVEPLAQSDGLHPDARALLDLLRREGPQTYGAAASRLGWGATRAWQAEARLRAAGLVRHGEHGRAYVAARDLKSDNQRTGP